ncbi:hypothetical protein M885DRAFT_542395 [Pelagophyceae sp. CCMP2097]|nr:hypothetical protein M885DRAFT_542395 [Pelagophyceae sp. CCMP2097]
MASAWATGSAGASVAAIKTRRRVEEVHIDGLAMLKLVKHCRDSLPQMVAGSLLGLDSGKILEITHCFPFPAPREKDEAVPAAAATGEDAATENLDGEEYQMEMMKMLREVNVDNNCVGWYKSIYAGSYCHPSVVESQFNYQENLSDNCVVLLYDPIAAATKGALSVKAYQLSEAFTESHRAKDNKFIAPSRILVELPLKIRNPGLVTAFLYDVAASGVLARDDFDGLSAAAASTGPLERYLEHMCQWVDELTEEHSKFQYHLRNVERVKDQARWAKKHGEEPEKPEEGSWKNAAPPSRLDSLLIANQINEYCQNIQKHSTTALSKQFLQLAFAN